MEENQVYIPNGWHLKQVQEFAIKMRSGGTPKSDNPNYYNGEIPFVAIDDLTTANKYLEKTQKQITKEGLINSSAWLVPINSLMYSIYATLGVPRINLIEAATNQAILNLIPDTNKITLEFLYYLLLEKRSTILAHSAHTTQSNLNAKVVKELEFVFPKSTTEQTTIANILSKTDQSITNTLALITKYTRIKTGLMQDLLTKGIGNDEFELVPTELKNIKAKSNFLITTLKTITKVRQGYQIAISARKKEEGENRFVYITVQYLNNPKRYLEYIENPPAEVISKLDDILFTRTGNTGQIVTNIVGVYHNNFFKVDFDKKLITKEYLLLFLKWEPVKDLILELAGTTTIPDLKHKDFYSIPIFFPKTIEEQNIIADNINKASEIVERYETELLKLQSLKKGLMQDLLSGKVRVNK
jgi:type I restriction enzyme S subunit